ncbi:DinB family protein [Kitasatospora sp. NPDC052896]|uniref:DinB family protein n=1 Tax=Kitasatospora sp. NPDC052896 TaxID=3364061 RepID=UPI0037CA005B
MTEIPAENLPPIWPGTRPTIPTVGDERAMLTAMLDWHRATFELKCADVPAARLSEPSVPPSGLSLHGLLRHLAGVERWWFQQQFAGSDVPDLYYSDDDPDQDFERLDGDTTAALAVWRAECESSRQVVAATPSLNDLGVRQPNGKPIALRWVLLHLIAEYARHNGHADLLRESLDGLTGV